MTGIERIAAERARQIEREGFTPEHDYEHSPEELELAAVCYATPPEMRNASKKSVDDIWVPFLWPWDGCWWKPSTRERDLEKAGALMAAALDLRMRKAMEGK